MQSKENGENTFFDRPQQYEEFEEMLRLTILEVKISVVKITNDNLQFKFLKLFE